MTSGDVQFAAAVQTAGHAPRMTQHAHFSNAGEKQINVSQVRTCGVRGLRRWKVGVGRWIKVGWIQDLALKVQNIKFNIHQVSHNEPVLLKYIKFKTKIYFNKSGS